MPDKHPNVLVIMSDQHHAGIMGCAGDPVARTPNLDALAARGIRFSNTYCQGPVCGPSRMSFVTSRQPFEIDCWDNGSQLSSDVATFAHAFGAAGYETVLSGRMHFVGHDQYHGFQRRVFSDVAGTVHLAGGWKLENVLGDLIDTCGCGHNSIIKSGPGKTGYQTYDQAVTDATVNWLAQRKSEDGPFLLTVGFVLPHCPFVCPPEDFDDYARRIGPADLPDAGPPLHPSVQSLKEAHGLSTPPPPDAQWRAHVAYYGMCSLLDRNVGRILQALEAADLAGNTLVVYTSDHGEQLGEHGLWWKGTFYDGCARVPLLVARPGAVDGGQVLSQNVGVIDIGPTVLDMAGVDPLPGASGNSFRPLLQAAPERWHDTAFSEYTGYSPDGSGASPWRMVRRGPWKYNAYHRRRPELFDLAEDPAEQHDRWDDPACKSIRAELEALIMDGWGPEAVAQQQRRYRQHQRLLSDWIRKAAPPEPIPVWFTQPLENSFDSSRRPQDYGH